MKVSVAKAKLKNNITGLLKRSGFNIDEIKSAIRSWEYASLSEKYSHGFDRITWLLRLIKQNKIIPNSPVKITRKGLFTHIDGKNSLGYLAAEKATNFAVRSAKQYGIGIVTISDCYPTGCMGQYTENISKSSQIGIVISHSTPRVAAFGTVARIYGTMGHSFGFPSRKIPYIYDASVGSITNGMIMHHYVTKTKLPEDSVFTKNGVATTNPSEVIDKRGFFDGIIAIGGGREAHKISGLAGSLELLTRLALIYIPQKTEAYSIFMAVDPSYFGNREIYKNLVSQLQKEIKKSKRDKEIKRVYFAGEKSYLLRRKNSAKKTILITKTTYQFLFDKNENAV